MAAEEFLKTAGVCCPRPACHTPCQIKPAACRAGCSHCLLHPQCISQHCTGREAAVCFAGRNALFSCSFPCGTLMAHATLSLRWVPNHHSDFQRPDFGNIYLL